MWGPEQDPPSLPPVPPSSPALPYPDSSFASCFRSFPSPASQNIAIQVPLNPGLSRASPCVIRASLPSQTRSLCLYVLPSPPISHLTSLAGRPHHLYTHFLMLRGPYSSPPHSFPVFPKSPGPPWVTLAPWCHHDLGPQVPHLYPVHSHLAFLHPQLLTPSCADPSHPPCW